MYDTLVLGSGANRGIMFGGVIKSLEKRGILTQITTFVGASIGALFAAACAVGFTADQIHQLVLQTDIKDSKPTNELEIVNLYKRFALYTNKKRERLVRKIIAQGPKAFADITLRQLYVTAGITLIVTRCCINTQTTEYVSHKNHPDLSVVRCVCMSMTIPLVFQPYEEDDFLYVDGAMFGHGFPIGFDRKDDDTCLGFRLRGVPQPLATTNITDYLVALFMGHSQTLTGLKHTIDLTCDVQIMGNVIKKGKKEELMQLAFEITEQYLNIHP